MAKKKAKKHSTTGGQQFLSDEQFVRQRIRTLQIGTCYASDDFSEYGEGYVIVSRRHTGGRVSFAAFLVDSWCIGVKNSFYRLRMEDYELEELVDQTDVTECSYEEAHNWIYGAIDFAEEAGIKPDKSFALTRFFLEEDTDDVPLIEHEFGKDGKHCLVTYSNLETSRYLPLLRKNLGEGNFDYLLPAGSDNKENDDDVEGYTNRLC